MTAGVAFQRVLTALCGDDRWTLLACLAIVAGCWLAWLHFNGASPE